MPRTEKKEPTPLDAAVNGTLQVMPGVLSSFGTTTFIFGSLAFLKGDIGAVLKIIPVVMLAVLVISLIEAFLILPNHLRHALENAGNERTFADAPYGSVCWVDARKCCWTLSSI